MGKDNSGVKRDWIWIALLGLIVIFLFNRLLFTDQIIRASDVITQLFWSAKGAKEGTVFGIFSQMPEMFHAKWYPENEAGRTGEGGANSLYLLFYHSLILHFFPFPSSIAWQGVLYLIWGGIGTFLFCKQVKIGNVGAFAAGLLFAICTENASLINAGHIQKIETISWAPWIFLFLEKSLRSGRLFHYSMTALLLSIQFFTMHWQVSFYTCLAVGAYWFFHVGAEFISTRKDYVPKFKKDFVLALAMVILFFTTSSMSFIPVFSWSQQSERGGGMAREEGMSWSMPPEEIVTYFVPGLFGYSRQEAGDRPTKGQVYYWGRMYFTQTNDYLGLLPWLLIPLAFIFKRDRYTWFFGFLMGATLIMALGKYTFIYQFMFDHLPGFSTFRVPKMILFLFAFGAGVLGGRGVDVLLSTDVEKKAVKRWLIGVSVFVVLTGLLWLFIAIGRDTVLSLAAGVIDRRTRYQAGGDLVEQRYINMVREAGIAFGVACAYLLIFVAWVKKWLPRKFFLPMIILLFVGDLWRVNERFFVLTNPPEADKKKAKSDVIEFLEKNIGNYRVQPLDGESPFYYSDYGLPNISAYVTISEKRYKEFMDIFDFMSPMADILNLKYIIMTSGNYEAQKADIKEKYSPVYQSTTGSIVLENMTVLPKAWVVPSIMVVPDVRQRLMLMSSPYFKPASIALVESPSPIPLASSEQTGIVGGASVEKYEAERITINASVERNALLVLGEKYYRWWYAKVDGKKTEIYPVNHILRGVYLTPGKHKIEFYFAPLTFKIGKYLTFSSFAFIIVVCGREFWMRKKEKKHGNPVKNFLL